MQQRYYDPVIGRFLSVDPITADGNNGANFNRFWYANNNPYLFTDPDGRQAKSEEEKPETDGQRRMREKEQRDRIRNSDMVIPNVMTMRPVPDGGFTGLGAATRAAQAGVASAGVQGTDKEWGGLIVQIGDGFFPTTPVTYSGKRGGQMAWKIPLSWTVIGDYHTHPGGRGSYVFSPNDVSEAERTGWIRYVGFHEQRNIRMYDPATMRPGIRGLPTPGLSAIEARQASYGELICEGCFP
jgi:uncharacterized protein RhaS with RHS repeats